MRIIRAELSFRDVKPGTAFAQIGPYGLPDVFLKTDEAIRAPSLLTGRTYEFNPVSQVVRIVSLQLVEQYAKPEPRKEKDDG